MSESVGNIFFWTIYIILFFHRNLPFPKNMSLLTHELINIFTYISFIFAFLFYLNQEYQRAKLSKSLFEQITHLHIELPEPEQTLNCFNEEANTFDRFAIKVCEKDKTEIVGHLPMEISQFTKFLPDRGANYLQN